MIRVEIVASGLNESHHDVTIGEKLVKALKDAGIPVEASAFVIRSVKHGTLSYWRGHNSAHMFSWREDDADNSQEGFVRTMAEGGVTVYKNGRHDDEL